MSQPGASLPLGVAGPLLLTPAEMAELDRRTINELGISGLTLMESAAQSCVDQLIGRYGVQLDAGTLVLCGPGNNGGDGLAIARLLAQRGLTLSVVLLCQSSGVTGDSAEQLRRLLACGVEPQLVDVGGAGSEELAEGLVAQPVGVVVDALFGTGLRRALSGSAAALVEVCAQLRAAGAVVLAVDVPSGVDGASGKPFGPAVEADLTVSFAAAKRGHHQQPGKRLRGDLVVADIGIPTERWPMVTRAATRLIGAASLAELFSFDDPAAHKGTYGHVLVVAGSLGTSGAGRLAAEAALRGGAGLVTLAIPAGLPLDSLAQLRPEVMLARLETSRPGFLSMDSWPRLRELVDGCDVMVVGPGLGLEPETLPLVRSLVAEVALPAVVDADALNALALMGSLEPWPAPRVLTPHPGEARRLQASRGLKGQLDRVLEASDLASAYGSVVALKGASTVIAEPGGGSFINPTGNPGMATAGSGDVLAGLLGALLARGAQPLNAACGAVYWHGRAGDLAAERLGTAAMLSGDIIDALAPAWKEMVR